MGIRDEELADRYLCFAGLAGVYLTEAGRTGKQKPLTIDAEEDGRLVVWCMPKDQDDVIKIMKASTNRSYRETLDCIQRLADERGVGVTPHGVAVGRIFEVVNRIHYDFDRLNASGQLREFNRQFKDARAGDTTLRYLDFVHIKKLGMIEAIAIAGANQTERAPATRAACAPSRPVRSGRS